MIMEELSELINEKKGKQRRGEPLTLNLKNLSFKELHFNCHYITEGRLNREDGIGVTDRCLKS